MGSKPLKVLSAYAADAHTTDSLKMTYSGRPYIHWKQAFQNSISGLINRLTIVKTWQQSKK